MLAPHCPEGKTGACVFRWLVWNVLAREFTYHNQEHHLSGSRLENTRQTRARYGKVMSKIKNANADLICLQECGKSFLEFEFNPGVDWLRETYDVYLCAVEDQPGAAILVRKMGQVVSLSEDGATAVGGRKDTGGPSKIAAVLPVKVDGREIWVVSLHLTIDWEFPERRLQHLDLLAGILEQKPYRDVLLGGDFNCEVKSLSELASHRLFDQRLHLLTPTCGFVPTGLNGKMDVPKIIDYVWASPSLLLAYGWFFDIPADPICPYADWDPCYGASGVCCASDHVCLCVDFHHLSGAPVSSESPSNKMVHSRW